MRSARAPSACAYDTLLCHNSRDKQFVRVVGKALKLYGLNPWLDEWELPPGCLWQRELEDCIESIGSAVVFIGHNGTGVWQDFEIDALLREFMKRRRPIILVIAPSVKRIPKLPVFLRGFMWVDFRTTTPDPIKQLLWGITGVRPRL